MMRGTALIPALMAASFLSACGTQPAATNMAAAPATNAYAERVAALPAGQRNATMFRAIMDADFQCHRVSGTTRQADVQGTPAWIAQCDDGGRWQIVLDPSGTAKVTQLPSNPAAATG